MTTVLATTILMTFGCKEDSSECRVVKVDLNETDNEYICFSQFADSLTYISLKDVDSCRIGNIKNIRLFEDSLILIHDSGAEDVKIFKKSGHYVSNVGSKGRGSGEYIRASQIDVDNDNREILIFDDVSGRMLRYSFDYKYISADSIRRADDIAYIGDGKYLAVNYDDLSDASGVFIVTGTPFKREKILGCRDNVSMNKPMEIFNNDGKLSVMSRQYENRLMEWENGRLKPVIEFEVLQSPKGSDIHSISADYREMKKYPDRVEFRNSDRWFYTYFWTGNELRHIFWDKTKDTFEVVEYLKNDIDSVYGSLLPLCVDNSFVSAVDGGENENPRLQFIHLKK